MQATQVQSLVQEDSTCRCDAKPSYHNYCAPQPRAGALQQEKPPQWEAHASQLESNPCLLQLEEAQQRRTIAGINK